MLLALREDSDGTQSRESGVGVERAGTPRAGTEPPPGLLAPISFCAPRRMQRRLLPRRFVRSLPWILTFRAEALLGQFALCGFRCPSE